MTVKKIVKIKKSEKCHIICAVTLSPSENVAKIRWTYPSPVHSLKPFPTSVALLPDRSIDVSPPMVSPTKRCAVSNTPMICETVRSASMPECVWLRASATPFSGDPMY